MEVLTWDSTTSKWLAQSAQAGSDTNESVRVGNLVNNNCSGTDKVRGVLLNGTIVCGTDQTGGGGGGNPFDQILNTTSNVTFNNITITSNLSASTGFFSFLGSLFNRITNIWAENINVSQNIEVNQNVTASFYFGDGSQLSNIPTNSTIRELSLNQTEGDARYVNSDGDNITGNLTSTAWFNGLFNWTTLTNWLSFNGAPLSFNETKLNFF